MPSGGWLAFKLALNNKVHFIESSCFRINLTDESLSQNAGYAFGNYELVSRLALLPMPKKAHALVLKRKANAEHTLAESYLKQGQSKKAWKYHVKSLGSIQGFKSYFLFTRKMFNGFFKHGGHIED